jgi:hypothetical protein
MKGGRMDRRMGGSKGIYIYIYSSSSTVAQVVKKREKGVL